MATRSFRGSPGHPPVRKLCDKCGKKTGKPAVQGRKLCRSCQAGTPEAHNSPGAKHSIPSKKAREHTRRTAKLTGIA